MQRVSLKIHRKQKESFYQPDTLYPLFRGNGGYTGYKSRYYAEKMYPDLYPVSENVPSFVPRRM